MRVTSLIAGALLFTLGMVIGLKASDTLEELYEMDDIDREEFFDKKRNRYAVINSIHK